MYSKFLIERLRLALLFLKIDPRLDLFHFLQFLFFFRVELWVLDTIVVDELLDLLTVWMSQLFQALLQELQLLEPFWGRQMFPGRLMRKLPMQQLHLFLLQAKILELQALDFAKH